MEHVALLRMITALVRDAGPVAALDELRRTRPALVPAKIDHVAADQAHDGYHETLAVFYVWAVDRLAQAGLSDMAILWHPLTDTRSPMAWWDESTLSSVDARQQFVASTTAAEWEPQPTEPTNESVAA